MDIAVGAVTISKSAVSRDDWKLVATYWQQAINLLKQIPSSSPKRAIAQTKLSQYQRLLAEAKEKSAPPLKKTTQGDLNPQFFSVPIKGRRHGTPIIEVNFNGRRKFEMLFDTGANVTLITREIAYSLQLKPQGLTKVTVADGAEVTVYKTTLNTLEIDGRVKRNMPVVVAPPAMQESLLGQDFYEGYDIAIKEDIIEFRKRS
jgi:predicted aspartyl protease